MSFASIMVTPNRRVMEPLQKMVTANPPTRLVDYRQPNLTDVDSPVDSLFSAAYWDSGGPVTKHLVKLVVAMNSGNTKGT